MKTECMVKSVKSDARELGILACILGSIGFIGWLLVSNWATITTSINLYLFFIMVCMLSVDILTIRVSQDTWDTNDPINKPAPITVSIILYLILIGVLNMAALVTDINIIILSVVNTALIIAIMVLVRMYVRCKDPENEGV